jgi:cytochrome c nitrite reductase small subunit
VVSLLAFPRRYLQRLSRASSERHQKYFFKGMDGMKHVGYFLTYSEHQAIRAEDASAEVIMDNCIRCHTQLNQEFVKTGRIDYMMAKRGEGLACWDCHRNVPHGGMNSLSATPGAETQVPLPSSPVPEWIQQMVGHRQSANKYLKT